MKISIVGRKALGVLAVCMALANFLFAQSFKTLVDFDIADGSSPTSGSLIKDAAGNLYGSTSFGGTSGFGEIFKITNAGNLITLYSFCSQSGCPDGMNPNAGLVRGSDGNFYGTTRGAGETGSGRAHTPP